MSHVVTTPAPRSRRGGVAAWCAGTVAVALVVLGAASLLVLTRTGQSLDQRALGSLSVPWPMSIPIYHLLGAIAPPLVLLVGVACAAVALLRRRPDLVVGALTALAGANLTTRVLKFHVVDRPDLGVDGGRLGLENTSPSGHTTAAMSFAVALVLVAPPVLRCLAGAVGAGWAVLAGLGMILVGGHRPGDVVAGVGVGLVWGAVAVGAAAVSRRWVPARWRGGGDGAGTRRVPAWAEVAAPVAGAALAAARLAHYGLVLAPGPRQTVAGLVVVVVTVLAAGGAVAWVAVGVRRHLA